MHPQNRRDNQLLLLCFAESGGGALRRFAPADPARRRYRAASGHPFDRELDIGVEPSFDWPEKAVKEGDYRQLHYIWWPTPSSVRKTERFKRLVRDAGMVDYWRAKGWPDLCHPMGTDDFACN